MPDFRIFPGAYITELPPSRTLLSTTLHVCVLRSKTLLAMASSAVAAAKIRPSGSTSRWG